MKPFHLLYYLILIIFVLSCSYYEKKEETKRHLSIEKSIKLNKKAVDQYSEIIKDEIRKRKWEMTCTETGLWYEIYQKGSGKKAEKGKYAEIVYNMELLNGTNCNNNDSLDFKKFLIGKGGIESGIEEGVLLLHEGDKARMVFPPHLAYGVSGDGNKIPSFAIIIYDIELISITEK